MVEWDLWSPESSSESSCDLTHTLEGGCSFGEEKADGKKFFLGKWGQVNGLMNEWIAVGVVWLMDM